MSEFVDLTQPFYDGMPGFAFTRPGGERVVCSAEVREFMSHADTAPFYDGRCAFAYTEVSFATSIGTRLDAPYIRYPEARDIAGLELAELILPGRSFDVRGRGPGHPLEPDEVDLSGELEGHAVLFNFGWDAHWGGELYLKNPYLATGLVDALVARGVKLVGVDTVSVDGGPDPERPAHSRLLAKDILIVEDLCGVERLHGQAFRFFALPIPARGAASMPVRAVAEITGPRSAGKGTAS